MGQVLIVDDKASVRKLLSAELTLSGYQVTAVGDASSAREYLALFQPDIVVMDLILDGLEGLYLLEDIKTDYPRIPVIILTAYETYRADPRASLADAYVSKSFDLQEVKENIRRHMVGTDVQ